MKAHLFLLTACLSLTAADLGVISPRHGILLSTETTRQDFHRFEVELKPNDSTNVVTLTITNNLILHSDLVSLPSGRTVMGLKAAYLDGSVSDMAIYTFDLRRAGAPAPSAVRAVVSAGSEPSKSLINELQRIQTLSVPPPPMPFDQVIREPYMPVHQTLMVPSRSWLLPSTNGLDMETGLPTTDINIALVHTNAPAATYAGPTPEEAENMRTNLNYCWYRLASNVNCQSTNHDHEVVQGMGSTFIPKIKPVQSPKPMPNAKNQTYGEYLDWLADRKGKRRNE